MTAKTEFASAIATQAKRKALRAEIATLAARFGARISEDDGTYQCITLGPYRVSMDWAYPKVGAFLGHWFTEGAAQYPKTFAVAIGGTLNTCHYGKATTCETTWQGFVRSLEAGFSALVALGAKP